MYAITAVVVSVASSAYAADKAEDAADDARDQAKRDRADALRAEQFAETTGEGQGSLGNISLALDDEVNLDDIDSGVSNVSI